MGVLISAAWQALRRRMKHAAICDAARRAARAQPGVAAVDTAWDDESPVLRIAVRLRVAAGFDAGEVAERAKEAICRQLPVEEVLVHVIDGDSQSGKSRGKDELA